MPGGIALPPPPAPTGAGGFLPTLRLSMEILHSTEGTSSSYVPSGLIDVEAMLPFPLTGTKVMVPPGSGSPVLIVTLPVTFPRETEPSQPVARHGRATHSEAKSDQLGRE